MNEVSSAFVKKHSRLIIILANLVIFIMLELCTRVLMAQGYIPYVHMPTTSEKDHLYADINSHFGVWRHPNRTVRHTLPCFDVTYSSNSYGARDVERKRDVPDELTRAVVLGDSFVDGYGVELEERMTNIAEDKSNIDFLNFGISGSFGAVQQWLLYKELASKFEHEEVAIFLFPTNDFDDNDPSNFPPSRYRPYLKKAGEKFEIYYTTSFGEHKQTEDMGIFRVARRKLYNNIYLLNALRQIGTIFEESELKDSLSDAVKSEFTVSYNDYTAEEFELLSHAYSQIIKLANNKKVSIFIIPRELEFMQAEDRETFRLVRDMKQFANKFDNVEVHDLMPIFLEYADKNDISYESFFHRCDGHWSPLGNEIAGNYLAKIIND